jgi:hypothetical protein
VKRILQIAILVLFAVVLSGLSMFIKTGTDARESGTIGIVSKWGFPVHYRVTAPGLARAQFDTVRFWLNSITWCAVLMTVWALALWRGRKA